MPKVTVPYNQYLTQADQALSRGGVFLVSPDAAGRPNPMTIGWGLAGTIWGKPIYMALVRPSRYTYGCIEAAGDFTVNVPYPELGDELVLCGSRSGRDLDKFAECGFEALPGPIASPGITACGLIFYCRVVHHNDLIPENLAPEITPAFYAAGDFHRCYFGEIVAAVADEDFAARFGL